MLQLRPFDRWGSGWDRSGATDARRSSPVVWRRYGLTFTYDPTTDVGYIRLLIGDTEESDPSVQIFQDEELSAFLAREGDAVLRAAASALESMARQEVMILKVIRRGDLSTDGAKVAAELRASAKGLREQDASGTGAGEVYSPIDWAEWVVNASSEAERVVAQAQREVG